MSMSMSGVRSLEKMLMLVGEQIEIGCFSGEERSVAEDIRMIIAEIYLLPENAMVRIDGTDIPCGLVAQVYSRLDGTHVRAVTERFLIIDYPIRHKKAYLRTALYNRVFEQESAEANDFHSSL